MDVDGPDRHHLRTLLTQLVEHLEVTLPDLDGRVRDGVLVVIPAFNEAENVGAVVSRVPDRVCGLPTTVVVVDDPKVLQLDHSALAATARTPGKTVVRFYHGKLSTLATVVVELAGLLLSRHLC